MAKKILIGVVALVVVLVGVVVVAPSFIDSAALKSQATQQVRTATGRDLNIDGNLEIRVFPAPALTANGVRLSNAPGAAAEQMVTLKAVEVRVALVPLLSGQVQVERVRLLEPVIEIEAFADGRTNLEFQPQDARPGMAAQTPQTQSSAPSSPTAENAPNIRLDNIEIVDGLVRYRDAKAGTVEQVQDINTTLRAGSLNGPFEAQGEARVRGVPLAFEVSLGQIIAQRTVPVNAVIHAPGGAKTQITGGVFELETHPRFKGKIKAEGESLAGLLNAAAGGDAAPAMLAQTFGLETDLDAAADGVSLSGIDMQIGKTRATGTVKAELADGVNFDVRLKAAHVDVDALLATSDAGGASPPAKSDAGAAMSPTPPGTAPKTADQAQGFAFPEGVNGTVEILADAVTVKAGLISDVRIAAELADGELALSQLQLMAPGVTEVAVFGFVRPQNGVPRFEGDVELTSADPAGATKWLGVNLPAGMAERVKRVAYKSKLTADAKQVTVSDLSIRADQSTLSGGVTLALRKRLSFGADLALDRINLDTYLNGGAAKAQPNNTAQNEASQPEKTASKNSPAANGLAAVETWAGLSALNDFDANLKVRVGDLTHGGRQIKNVTFDGTLYAGALELRSFKLGDFGGASGVLSGTVNGFGGIPEVSKLKLDAKVKNASGLAQALGVAGVPQGVKAVALNVTADGSLLKPRLSATVDALKGAFGAEGRFSLLPIGFGFDGTVNAQHPDMVALLKTLDIGYKPAGPLGALSLNAKVQSDGQTHTVSGLKTLLGKTPINGDIKARTGGAKPQVTASVQTGDLVLDRFLPKAENTAALSPSRSRWGKRPANTNVIYAAFGGDQLAQSGIGADKRWSRDQFDLSALNLVNADVTLLSDSLQFGDYKLSAADIHATVKDGVLDADKITGTLFGGPVSGSAIVRANGTPTIESNIKLDALQVNQAVKAVSGQDLAAGNLSLDLAFNADGLSPAALVSSLAGNGNLNIAGLDVKQGGKGSALSGVIGLVAAMNQLSLSGNKSSKGLADLGVSFDIQEGVANASKLSLTSAMGSGSGSGTVDIARWAIDFAGNMTVEPNLLTSLLSKGKIGRQEVPFAVKGALDDPGINLGTGRAASGGTGGGNALQNNPLGGLLQQALPGLKLPQQKTQPPEPAPAPQPQQQDGTLAPPPPQGGSAAPQQQAPSKPSADDIIRQLMKGL